jgi:DNA-binding PadR family transcriptional regulator
MDVRLSADLLRGHTDTIVLGILSEGDAYGFEIYHTILERTGGEYELRETTLYSSYKRLEREGCVEGYWGEGARGARRRYYQITGQGREVLRQNLSNWRFTERILGMLLPRDTGEKEKNKGLIRG